jgi:hypothetical protein
MEKILHLNPPSRNLNGISLSAIYNFVSFLWPDFF